jgi:serine/threonine-protein kinase
MDAHAGKYRDIAELGRGGMGDVYLTVALGPAGFNKLLVVKRLRQSLANDPEFLQMFLHEARIAARLNHPNIVSTYDVGFDGSRYYIAMEYLQGQSLFQMVRAASAQGGVPLSMHLRVLVDALAGLHYAHEQRDYDGTDLEIVHRDVSPPNIFVLYDGQVKIVDFGIAKTAQSTDTRAGIFKGKIQYVAPEQYTGGAIDRRTDIYSAGVILWEAATRRRMWKGVGDLAIMQRVVAGDLPLPSSVEPQVPKQLEAICMRALSLAKEDRYPTAAAFQADLEAFMTELGERATALEVGKYTADLFGDTRSRMKLIIDSQLKVLRENTDPLSLIPIVSSPQVTVTSTASWMPPSTIGVGVPRWRPAPSWIAGGTILLVAAMLAFVVGRRSASHPVEAAQTQPAHDPEPPRLEPSQVPPEETSAKSSVPDAVGARPGTPRTRLVITTIPKWATVALDDAALPADRRELELPQDNVTHRIWAAAPGYHPRAKWIRLDAADMSVKMVLESRPGPRQDGEPSSGREALRRTAPMPPSLPEEPATPTAQQEPALRELDFRPLKRAPPLPALDVDDPWKK